MDFYLAGDEHAPVLAFIHGGAWITGNKKDFAHVGRVFTQLGISVAILEYRLSAGPGKPFNGIRFPDHVNDCAAQIKELQTKHEAIFLMGHSAGANIAALLGLNASYLESSGTLLGLIGTEGIYDIPRLALDFAEPNYANWFLHSAIGDAAAWAKSSPQFAKVTHKTPWLLFHSDADKLVNEPQTLNFVDKLQDMGVEVAHRRLSGKAHDEVITELGPEDPTTQQIANFVHLQIRRRHERPLSQGSSGIIRTRTGKRSPSNST